jgi:hypothetical protein
VVQQAGDGSEVQDASESEQRAPVKLCVCCMQRSLADELLLRSMQEHCGQALQQTAQPCNNANEAAFCIKPGCRALHAVQLMCCTAVIRATHAGCCSSIHIHLPL